MLQAASGSPPADDAPPSSPVAGDASMLSPKPSRRRTEMLAQEAEAARQQEAEAAARKAAEEAAEMTTLKAAEEPRVTLPVSGPLRCACGKHLLL